jgi:hypothetical protein
MFVAEELGTSATISADSIYPVDLSQVSTYEICFIDNWFTNELFNASSLVVGQRIFVGGPYQSNTFTPHMVSLRRQGAEYTGNIPADIGYLRQAALRAVTISYSPHREESTKRVIK